MMHRYLKSSWAAVVILVFMYLVQCKIMENKDSADDKLFTVYCLSGLSGHCHQSASRPHWSIFWKAFSGRKFWLLQWIMNGRCIGALISVISAWQCKHVSTTSPKLLPVTQIIFIPLHWWFWGDVKTVLKSVFLVLSLFVNGSHAWNFWSMQGKIRCSYFVFIFLESGTSRCQSWPSLVLNPVTPDDSSKGMVFHKHFLLIYSAAQVQLMYYSLNC